MSEIMHTITEQLRQLQMLMHRASFHDFMGEGRPYNPNRGQGRVLAMLKIKPEISQRELTYLLGMSKQSLAELLSKLEKSEFITREPSEEDKRVMTIRLTEDGKKAAEDVGDNTVEAEKIFDCLNDEELAAFSEYLSRIISRYEEQFPGEDFAERRRTMEAFISNHGRGMRGHRGCDRDFHGHPEGHGEGFFPGRHDRREGCDNGPFPGRHDCHNEGFHNHRHDHEHAPCPGERKRHRDHGYRDRRGEPSDSTFRGEGECPFDPKER